MQIACFDSAPLRWKKFELGAARLGRFFMKYEKCISNALHMFSLGPSDTEIERKLWKSRVVSGGWWVGGWGWTKALMVGVISYGCGLFKNYRVCVYILGGSFDILNVVYGFWINVYVYFWKIECFYCEFFLISWF